jgi:hypothetical protein
MAKSGYEGIDVALAMLLAACAIIAILKLTVG